MDENLSTEVEVEEVAETSMEDTIQSTLDEINSRETARDDSGKFIPKKEPEPEKEEPEQITQSVDIIPPELQRLGIRKEAAAKIAKDPDVMAEFIRRSDEMHRGLDTYREKAQFGENIQKVIEPYMETIRSAGLAPDVAIKVLLNADSMLRRGSPEQKVQMLHQIARDYGIDVQQAAQTQQTNFNQTDFYMQQKLAELERWKEEQTRALQSYEEQSLNSEIMKFASQPDKVFFEEVRNDMAGLIQAGIASGLDDAYEKAIYANPQVRAKVLAQQQEKAEAERKAIANQKAQAARQAASVNVSRRGTFASAKPIGSMDETIREKARELGIL